MSTTPDRLPDHEPKGPHILFASAELAPLVMVGGLALAASGLVKELLAQGTKLTVVLPDYGDAILRDSGFVEDYGWDLDVPAWCGPTRARRGSAPGFDDIILIDRPGMARPHPYVDPANGDAWPDNSDRFFAFSAAIAALCAPEEQGGLGPDVLHLNDWHTAATVGFSPSLPPTVLTIHTLGYQGVSDAWWMSRIPHQSWTFAWYDVANPLAAAIRSVDRIIAVSPNYAQEILTPEDGMGLDYELRQRGSALVGIRNGIDSSVWDPHTDSMLPRRYKFKSRTRGKSEARAALLERAGWSDNGAAVVGVVSRLVDQKGIDTLMGAVPYLAAMNARIIMLGSGLPGLADLVRRSQAAAPDVLFAELDAFDEPFAHLIFAGSDLFCMPSRFEPCGLAQMQAMAYGTPTVATAVGGLIDTISDADTDLAGGTGFLTTTNDLPGLVDALHRSVRAWLSDQRFSGIVERGMQTDWSWTAPSIRHIAIYEELAAGDRDSAAS